MHLTRLKILFFTFIFTGLFSSEVEAQEDKSDCVIKLEQAQTKFDQGRIQDVEALITDCIRGTEFDKAEKTHALKLLTLTYLFLEEPELAEATMLHLLETSHEFVINQAIDPSVFINLYNKYRHDPLYSVGILAGGVVANPIVTQLNGTQDLNSDTRQVYTPLFGIRVGINGEYEFLDKFYASAGIYYASIKFQKIHESTQPFSNLTNEEAGFKGEESQTSMELPLLLQYHLVETRVLTPYVAAGVSPQFLISATYPGDALTNEIIDSAPVTSSTIDLIKDRNRFNVYAVGVVGLKYKIGEGFFNVQLRYSFGILQSTKEDSVLEPQDPNLLWDLGESTDGYRLQNLGISIGYTLHRYKPKKLR